MYSVSMEEKRIRVRIDGRQSIGEAAAFVDKAVQVIAACPAPSIFSMADPRTMQVMSPAASEAIASMLMRNNARIERAAFLVATLQGTFAMQLGRLIRESSNAGRQLFADPTLAVQHLVPALAPAEREALDAFVMRVKG